MIEIPKPGRVAADTADKAKGQGSVDPSDVHAMKSLMTPQGSVGELSAIFSAQLSRRTSEKTAAQGETLRQAVVPVKTDPDEENQEAPDRNNSDPDTEALAREVAEQILVSDPEYLESGAQSEVRIKIKASILKEAWVHLKQMPDRIKVRLVTTDSGSARILEASESALVSRLKTHFTGRINIKTVYLTQEESHERF